MALDVSQVVTIVAGTLCTGLMSIMLWKFRKHAIKQEKAAARREAKQEMHYRKLDATIFALASASENISGKDFKKAYDDKMREYEEEDEQMKKIIENK